MTWRDRHRTPEASHRVLDGSRGMPRSAWPWTRCRSSPRRRRPGLHRGHVRPHTAAIQRQAQIAHSQARQAAARPSRTRSAAGRVLPADRHRAGPVQGRGGPRPGRGLPGRPAGPGTGPSARCWPPRPNLPRRGAALRQQQLVAEVVKPAEAEAEKVRLLAQRRPNACASRPRPPPRTTASPSTACSSTNCPRSSRSRRRPTGRERQHPQRRRRHQRTRRQPRRPGLDHLRVPAHQPRPSGGHASGRGAPPARPRN